MTPLLPEGEFLYVGNMASVHQQTPEVDIFSVRATGASTPVWVIAGPNTQLWDPGAICIVRAPGAPSPAAR